MTKPHTGNLSNTDLAITRVFDAPRAVVWKVWTEPAHVARWWGPEHFTAPVCKIDLRVGGKYHLCMRAPDGQEFWSTGTYREIVPMEKIVCTDSFADEVGNIVPGSHYGLGDNWPDELIVTVTFEDLGDKTRLTLHHVGMPAGNMREMTEAGWSTSFDKLDAALTGDVVYPVPPDREIANSRVVNASRDRVFKAWTDPVHLARWWGPNGFTNSFHEFDLRPGGTWRFDMHAPNGATYPNESVFVEITKPERLVFDHVSNPPFRFVITFEYVSEQQTRVVFRMHFGTPEERERKKSFIGDANEQNLDRLEAELLNVLG